MTTLFMIILFLGSVALGVFLHRKHLKNQNTFDTTDAMVYTEAIAEIEEAWLSEQLGPYCHTCGRPNWDSSVKTPTRVRNKIDN